MVFGMPVKGAEDEGKEKHVPVIEGPAQATAGEAFEVTVIVGKEVAHPNTVEHHIKWVQLYGESGGKVFHIGTFDLGPTFAVPTITTKLLVEADTTLHALEYCNLHGVWASSMDISVN